MWLIYIPAEQFIGHKSMDSLFISHFMNSSNIAHVSQEIQLLWEHSGCNGMDDVVLFSASYNAWHMTLSIFIHVNTFTYIISYFLSVNFIGRTWY